jgi:GT2 family glycosyltransferase
MRLSVVVATYNRRDLLGRLLRALAQQTLAAAEFEVVVVVDGAAADSLAVCEGMRPTLPNLRTLPLERRLGQTHALNLGVAAARGQCLAFTDDDCRPEPEWLERLDRALREDDLVAGAIRSPRRPYFRLCHNVAQFHPFFPGRRGPTRFLAGANFACRRAWLEGMGGFDTAGTLRYTHDMVLALKAAATGVPIHFARDAVVWHEPDRQGFAAVLLYAAAHARLTVLVRRHFAAQLGDPLALRSPLLLALAAPLVALLVTGSIFLRNPGLWRCLHTAPVVCLAKFAWCVGAVAGLRAARAGHPPAGGGPFIPAP